MKHLHNFILKAQELYRDEDKNETTLEVYVCECGAGETIPLHSTFVSREDYPSLPLATEYRILLDLMLLTSQADIDHTKKELERLDRCHK